MAAVKEHAKDAPVAATGHVKIHVLESVAATARAVVKEIARVAVGELVRLIVCSNVGKVAFTIVEEVARQVVQEDVTHHVVAVVVVAAVAIARAIVQVPVAAGVDMVAREVVLVVQFYQAISKLWN